MSKILVPIVLLICSVGLFFSYIKPTYDSLQEYKGIEARLTTVQDAFATFDRAKSNLSSQYAAMRQIDLRKLERMMPDRVDVVQTIIDVDTLAQTNGVHIKSFTLPQDAQPAMEQAVQPDGSVAPAGKSTPRPFTVAASGSYSGFKKFLAGIESSLQLMDITTITIDAGDQKDSALPGEYEFQVAFTTYQLR